MITKGTAKQVEIPKIKFPFLKKWVSINPQDNFEGKENQEPSKNSATK